MHTLSIAIVLYRTPRNLLAQTLAHLRRALPCAPEQCRLILVDNSPTPCVGPELLELWPSELELIHGHGNPGFGAGHNLALARSQSRYHLILNPDALLDEDALNCGLDYLNAHAEAVLVAPRGQGARGEPLHLAKARPTLLALLLRGFLPARLHGFFKQELARYARHDLEQAQAPCPIEIASGCCMLVRTATLKAVGGFDSGYFLYFEDFDLSLRLGAQGQLVYLPDMGLVHYGGDAARKGWRHRAWFLRSAWRFFRRHPL
ncbi:MAG: glycosyltransferase family 2 protein [Gammaproteobacteria bacterium]|nr:glycosyltransferase family 2 protein [Gammaproteobacteria bacterium]